MATKNALNKIQTWQRTLARWRHSGESVAAFCRANKLSPPSLYHWRKRLAKARPSAAPAFVPVTVVQSAEESAEVAEFVLGSGRVLRLLGAVPVERLAALAKALEALSC